MYSLKLYHHPLSVCSMKVRLALEEKGLAWSGRVIDIVQQKEQLEPWYLALNPKGVVPTLQYSNAIVLLARKFRTNGGKAEETGSSVSSR